MFAVTTNDVPGYRITQVLGEVMGLTVRSANFGQNFTAGFRSLGGGEMPEYTKVIYESRWEVMSRMWGEAQARGPTPSWRCASTRDRSGTSPSSAPTAPPS